MILLIGVLKAILNGFGFHMKMVNWIIKCVSTTSFVICVNGESCSYFKGGRGLRQGDPMSPYLFTLIMEILNLIVHDKVECSEDFQYHFGCKRMKMTHVCFADDLLMFCHGDCKSVIVLKDAIDEFGAVSGLLPNYTKSNIIFGREMAHGKAKVDWKNICKPKCQRGLGLKYLGIWNKAMIVKYLWHMASYKESLWVKWISNEKLKGKRIWSVNEEMNDNWGWRNILRLRNEVREFIIMKVGDGSKTSVIYDNGSQFDILQSFIAHRDLYNARFNDKFVVKDIVINGVCDWPTEWKAKYPILAQIQNVSIDPSKSSKMVWKNKKGIENKFYVSQAYKDLQREGENVVWNRTVWFSQNNPKHAFVLWMSILNKFILKTK
ncbi:RNA-directed DNA polymerase, eukaryota, reverse transcriptase zinc-binding domain protein [Tanacetum coccineum]